MNRVAEKARTKIYMLAERAEDLDSRPFDDSIELTVDHEIPPPGSLAASADVISMYVRNEKWAEDAARSIRARSDLFLKPLFTLSDFQLSNLDSIVDAKIELPVEGGALNSRLARLMSISQRIGELRNVPAEPGAGRLNDILVLRYLLTRKGSHLGPVRDLSSSIGYSYPSIQSLAGSAPGEETKLLEDLEDALLLKGSVIDKLHLCPFCRHFQINFRETCPDCRSMNINEERTLHHFRCAYVGKEKDFKHGSILRCPKCGKEIRHIGVDYDRPGTNLWCGECNGNFSEPRVDCFCMNCAKTFSPEYALPETVKSFTLTQEGEKAAREGLLPETSLTEFLKKEFGFYKLEIFNEFLRLEVERCNRNNFDSTLGRVAIRNIDKAADEGGIVKARQWREDVALIFKDMLRESDILTEIAGDEILVILTHTDTRQAKVALGRVREKSERQVRRQIEIECRFLPLRGRSPDPDDIMADI